MASQMPCSVIEGIPIVTVGWGPGIVVLCSNCVRTTDPDSPNVAMLQLALFA